MSCDHLPPKPESIVRAARAYLGAKFHHQGRHPNGMDCIGLLVMAHRDAGYVLDDWTVYTRQPDPALLFEYIVLNFDLVKLIGSMPGGSNPVRVAESCEPAPADCLLFQFRKRGPQHAALANERRGFLHTWSEVGKVVEDENSPDNPRHEMWAKRLHSVWRVKPERWQP